MARLKFSLDYTHKLDDTGRTQTWPAGWEGPVDDEAVIKAAIDGKLADFVGKPPEPGAAAAAPVEIPEDYQDLKADDLLALAHQLGAGGDVNTKALALEFVDKIAADRKQSLL
jgi:hypothetical protein